MLALSNEPQKLLNMALDALVHVLEIECCWVQTINARKRSLNLAAERGFTPEMKAEMSAMDVSHDFTRQVVGLGDEIVIPNLSVDGRYGMSSFRSAGYKWVVAAPLMTYRVHGVLGIASRYKKLPRRETADLIMVIAGLIGNALHKASLSQRPAAPEKPARTVDAESKKKPAPPPEEPSAPSPHTPPDKHAIKPPDTAIPGHPRRTRSYRSLHR